MHCEFGPLDWHWHWIQPSVSAERQMAHGDVSATFSLGSERLAWKGFVHGRPAAVAAACSFAAARLFASGELGERVRFPSIEQRHLARATTQSQTHKQGRARREGKRLERHT